MACSRAEEYPTDSGRSIRSHVAAGYTADGAGARDRKSAIAAATTIRIIAPSRLQKFQQLTMKDFGRLEMRNVAEVRQKYELGARNRVGDVFRELGEIRAVLVAA